MSTLTLSDTEQLLKLRGYQRWKQKRQVITPMIGYSSGVNLPEKDDRAVFVCDIQSGFAQTYQFLKLFDLVRTKKRVKSLDFVLVNPHSQLILNNPEFHELCLSQIKSKTKVTEVTKFKEIKKNKLVFNDDIELDYDKCLLNLPLTPDPNLGIFSDQEAGRDVKWLDDYALGPMNFKEWKLALNDIAKPYQPFKTQIDPIITEALKQLDV